MLRSYNWDLRGYGRRLIAPPQSLHHFDPRERQRLKIIPLAGC